MTYIRIRTNMRKNKQYKQLKRTLTQQLKNAKSSVVILEKQIAKHGWLNAPVYMMIELANRKSQVASLEKQILTIKRTSLLFRMAEHVQNFIGGCSDLLLPRDQAAAQRKKARLSQWST